MSYTIPVKSVPMMNSTKSNLTPEQIQRMEENRLKALAKKQANSKNIENNNPKIETIHTMNKKPSIFNNPAPPITNNSAQPKKTSIFNNPSKITTLQTVSTSSSNISGAKTSSSSTSYKPTNQSSNNTGSTHIVSNCLVDSTNGRCIPLEEDPENRFEIIIGYNKALIDLFKTIQSRKYDPNTKRWNFSRKRYDDIILQIKHQLKDTIKLEPLDRSVGKSTFVKFFLTDKTHFEAVCDYKPELNEVFKSIKSKNYDTKTRKWSFELADYEELVASINTKLKESITVIPLPKSVKEIFKDEISGKQPVKINDGIDFDYLKKNVDPAITKTLLPFQIESICFAIRQQGRLLLADDMGLGKTIQGLAIASYYRSEWPLFIICPSSVKFMWKENTKRWISHSIRETCDLDEDDSIDEYVQVMENIKQKIKKDCKIVIGSYDLVAKHVETIMKNEYKMVIADECHLLKNIKAIRTKSALRLLENAKRVLLMSGTPALSRPSELFSQIAAINPNLFVNFHEFGMRYCDGKETKFGMDYSGYSHMDELKTILEKKLLIRREKKDVLGQLPSKMRETIVLNPALIELNSKTLKQASKVMEIENEKGGMAKHGALLNYFGETSRVKARAVAEYALDLLESGKKFLIFAHHQNMLNSLQEELEENKYDFIRIDGSTSSERRQELVDKFQKEENCLCALLSITAANSGITLTAASLVCFAELYWNPGVLVQAEDRVYRIGQKNAVNIQYLCANGTADDTLWPMIKDKLDVLGKVGLTKESMSDTKQSIMESSKKDIDELQAFNDLIAEKEKQNKITKYGKAENAVKEKNKSSKTIEEKKDLISVDVKIMKKTDKNFDDQSANDQKSATIIVGKNKSQNTQLNIDMLLNGVDFDEFDEASPKTKLTMESPKKKSTPPRRISTVIDEDNALLNGINLDAFEEDSPPKKAKSIFKKKNLK